MNLIISFSGRPHGNCDDVLEYIAKKEDTTIYFRNLQVHDCSNCTYECFEGVCKYRGDEIYSLYDSMVDYEKIFLIVPMYCGNPASLYFKFHERSQDYFMHNEKNYEKIVSKLYIIGIYGDRRETPDFLPCFEKWFVGFPCKNRVLGIERHRYEQKMNDKIVCVDEVRNQISNFIRQ